MSLRGEHERAPGARPVAGPLLAAGVAAALTLLGYLAWNWFDQLPCEGLGCLGPALLAVVIIPPGATLLGWLVLRRLGVPRSFLVCALTLGSALLVGVTFTLPDGLDVAYWAVPAVFAAAWAWALMPGRSRRPGLLLAGGLIVAALANSIVEQQSFERAAVERLDATDAPQLILDDERWELISTNVRTESFGTLYERRGEDTRLSITTTAAAPEAEPVADCADLTGTLFDNPADACVDVGDGLWEVRSGSLTRYLVLREDAVVGFEGLTPNEVSADAVRELLPGLRESDGAEIRDLLPD